MALTFYVIALFFLVMALFFMFIAFAGFLLVECGV